VRLAFFIFYFISVCYNVNRTSRRGGEMLNKRFWVPILVLSFLATMIIVVNAGVFSMVRVTYGGFIAVNGNVVDIYRNGQKIFSVTVRDAPKDVAADGGRLYVLYQDGTLEEWNMTNGVSVTISGVWLRLYTTLDGVLGVGVGDRLALVREESYPSSNNFNYRFVNLTVGYEFGRLVENYQINKLKYIGESGDVIYMRALFVQSDGSIGVDYYEISKDEGVEELVVGVDSTDEILEHVWGGACIVKRGIFYYRGDWDGVRCTNLKMRSRMIVWEGYGLELDFLGNLRDWDTGQTVATGVSQIVDASGGEVLYAGGDLGYTAVHAPNIPDNVGEKWSGDIGSKDVDVDVVSPGLAKIKIGEDKQGWLTVAKVQDGQDDRDGSASSYQLFGVIADKSGSAHGVYIETGSNMSDVRYASVASLSWSGGAIRITDLEETGTLIFTATDMPESVKTEDATTPTVELADVFFPNEPDALAVDVYSILTTMTEHPIDTINISAVDFPVSAGDYSYILRVPVVVGGPIGSVSGSWAYGYIGTQAPIYLGYDLQISGKTLEKALNWVCSDLGTPTLLSKVALACEDGEVLSPRIVVQSVKIEFSHRDRSGYWDKAAVDSGLDGNGKIDWSLTTVNGYTFPNRAFLKQDIATGILGIIVKRVLADSGNLLVAVILNAYPQTFLIKVSKYILGRIVDKAASSLKKKVLDVVRGYIHWKAANEFSIGRGIFTDEKIRKILDVQTDPYAGWTALDDFKYLGYKRFLETEGVLPFRKIVKWRDWVLREYVRPEHIQELRELIENSDKLGEGAKADLLSILDNIEQFGSVPGFRIFTTLAKVPFNRIGYIDDLKSIIADMRIKYLVHIDLFSPTEEEDKYRVHRITIGNSAYIYPSEKEVVDVDPINDLSYTASSATLAQQLGGAYTLRDATIWNLRGPGKQSGFKTLPEKNDQLFKISGLLDEYFEVRPGFATPAVNIDPWGAWLWGSSSIKAAIKITIPEEFVIQVQQRGVNEPSWWIVTEHTATNVEVSHVSKIWNDYSPSCQGTCVLGFDNSEIVAKDSGGHPAWFLANVVIRYSDIELGDTDVLGSENAVVYRDSQDNWHIMILPYDLEELWRFVSDGNRGFIFNTVEGNGAMFSLDDGDVCQLPGRVLDADGLDNVWIYQNGDVKHISVNYSEEDCSYTELGDKPQWMSGEDWSEYDFVGMVDWMYSKYIVSIDDGMLKMRKLRNGNLLTTVTLPTSVSDIKRVAVAVVRGSGAMGESKSSLPAGYLWVIWGDVHAVGIEAKPYDRHLRNAVVYELDTSGEVLDRFELGSVYIYPNADSDVLGVKYRGKYYENEHWIIGY